MPRPFVFRINAAELFTELQALNNDAKAAFITQFSIDLLTLNGTIDYSKKVIGETLQLIEKRSESGKLGGRPKSKTKAKVKRGLSKDKANTKQEEELEEEKKRFIIPTFEELQSYITEKNYLVNAQAFLDHYNTVGWIYGKNKVPIKNWKSAVGTWNTKNQQMATQNSKPPKPYTPVLAL